jgi:hypothetical protein
VKFHQRLTHQRDEQDVRATTTVHDPSLVPSAPARSRDARRCPAAADDSSHRYYPLRRSLATILPRVSAVGAHDTGEQSWPK